MKRTVFRNFTIGLICFGSMLFSGCGSSIVNDKVEHHIEAALPQYIGPAESYKAHVDGSLGGMMDGRLRELQIEGKRVQLAPELIVNDLQVEMKGVDFDRKKNQLRSVDSTQFQADFTEDVIQRYLEKNHPGIEGLRVRLYQDEIRIQARPAVLGVSTGVTVSGKLAVRNGDKVDFVPSQIVVQGIPSPKPVTNFVMSKVNPVLDIAHFNFPAKLTDIKIQSGKLVVYGTAMLGSKSIKS